MNKHELYRQRHGGGTRKKVKRGSVKDTPLRRALLRQQPLPGGALQYYTIPPHSSLSYEEFVSSVLERHWPSGDLQAFVEYTGAKVRCMDAPTVPSPTILFYVGLLRHKTDVPRETLDEARIAAFS